MKEKRDYYSRDVISRASNNPIPSVGTYRVTTLDKLEGTPNPKYRYQIAMGQDATTPLKAQSERFILSTSPWWSVRSGGVTTETNNWGNPFAIRDVALTNYKQIAPLIRKADAIALAQAHSKVRDYQNPFQGAVFLGELKEIVELIRNPFAKLAQLIRAFLEARNRRKSVADSWLELRFAILPLIGDIQALLEVAERKANLGDSVQFKAYGKSEDDYSGSQTVAFVYGANATRFMKWTLKAEVVYHFGIDASYLRRVFDIGDAFQESLAARHWVPAAWELVPWSFLIDYVVNVGDILSASFEGEFRTRYCAKSVIQTRHAMWSFSPFKAISPSYIVSSGATPVFAYEKREVERVPSSLGIPPLTVSLPGSNIQKLNIAALITSLTTTKKG